VNYAICIMLIFIAGCSESRSNLEEIAVQHTGRGIMNNDACKTLYREDGRAVKTPQNFEISPFDAIIIAKKKLNYSCGNKLGVRILSDGKSYYIVRLGSTQDAIIINGVNGVIESKGFMTRDK
jgi:hypothetical protein